MKNTTEYLENIKVPQNINEKKTNESKNDIGINNNEIKKEIKEEEKIEINEKENKTFQNQNKEKINDNNNEKKETNSDIIQNTQVELKETDKENEIDSNIIQDHKTEHNIELKDEIDKEIEKNNLILSKNNNKTVDIEKNYKENGLGIKCKYKNIVIVEGIDLITDFLHEIETFLNENEIKENYNYQNIGKGKYSFGFQRKDNAYDFHKFVNLLQLVNKKYFGIRCRLKIFNIKNLKYNSSYKNNFIKNKFYFKDKFNNNNYFALKNNLCGPFNSYFLNKGQKKFVTNDDTESMNEIVKLNYYKFKNNEMNYINSENIYTIPLI